METSNRVPNDSSARQRRRRPEQTPKPAKKRGVSAPFIFLLVLLVIIVFFSVAIWFNIFGIRESAMGLLYTIDKRTQTVDDDGYTEAERREAAADKKAQEAQELKSQLETQKADLDKREIEISNRETELTGLAEQVLGEQKSIEEVGEIYTSMKPQDAANILSSINNIQNISIILQNVDLKVAARILAAMDPDLAGKITLQIMNQPVE